MSSNGNGHYKGGSFHLLQENKWNKVDSKSEIRLAISDDGCSLLLQGSATDDVVLAFDDLIGVRRTDFAGASDGCLVGMWIGSSQCNHQREC